MQVTDAMVEAALANLPNRHLMNKTGVRAALVDVRAVEPVAWLPADDATSAKGSDTRNHADVERYDGIN